MSEVKEKKLRKPKRTVEDILKQKESKLADAKKKVKTLEKEVAQLKEKKGAKDLQKLVETMKKNGLSTEDVIAKIQG